MEETVCHSPQCAVCFIIFALCSRRLQTSLGIGPISVFSTLISVMAASKRSFMMWAFYLICFSCGSGSASGKKKHDNNNFSSWHSDCCITLPWLISYLLSLPPCSNLIPSWALPVTDDLIIYFRCLSTSFFHTSTIHTRDFWALTQRFAATLNNSYRQCKWKIFIDCCTFTEDLLLNVGTQIMMLRFPFSTLFIVLCRLEMKQMKTFTSDSGLSALIY